MAMKSWSEFYGFEYNIETFLHNLNVHKEFISEIVKRSNGKKILEVGCGPGGIAIFLSCIGFDVTAVDNNTDVLERASALNKKLNGKVRIVKADAFKMPFADNEFDLSFSQGLLEHFQDRQVCEILKEKTRVSKIALFSVPNSYYRVKDVGDERLLSVKQWEKIIKDFDILFSKPYFYISTKRNFLVKKPLMYMAGLKKRII